MRVEKIKISKLESPEGAKNSKVFMTEVTPDSLLGIRGSNSGLSSETVKFNHLTIFCLQNTVPWTSNETGG